MNQPADSAALEGAAPGSGSHPDRAAAPPPVVAMPTVGDRLESFEILDSLGAGGMGAVYLASDLRLDRLVALKILPPDQANDRDVVARFEQEGRAAARLDHENIARVHTLGYDKGFHFIAFEYVEGTTLRQRVERDGVLGVPLAIDLALQICKALEHANERGLVHRDIKPSNIIVTPRGRAKLVDMGLARSFERSASDHGLTQSGVTLGTFDYISPEQARDPRDVDVRSDLYSLGCTLYHALAGHPPFPQGTVLQKLLQHQGDPPPDIRAENPAVPAELANIVLRLMEKEREKRFQTPQELETALELVGSQSRKWLAPAPATHELPTWEKHLVWALPGLGLLLLVVFLMFQNAQDSAEATRDGATVAKAATRATIADADAVAPPKSTTTKPQPVAKIEPPRAATEISLDARDDLAKAIAEAPDFATIVLTSTGRYFVSPVSIREQLSARPNRTLVIKAAPQARPVIAVRNGEPVTDRAFLAFAAGRVQVEGIEFQLGTQGEGSLSAAILARDTQLTITRCVFQAAGEKGSRSRSAILLQRSAPGTNEVDAAPIVRVASCAFGKGIVGLRATGAVDAELRDCTFGPDEPVAWFDNAELRSPALAHLALRHVSVLAGAAPVLRLSNTAAWITMEDSVIGAAGSSKATLVSTDDPARLDWLGRENLYGGIGAYLDPLRSNQSVARITSFAAWAESPGLIRELRSVATDAHIWAHADPVSLLNTREIASAYELGTFAPSVGARQGPRGSTRRIGTVLSDLLETAREALPPTKEVAGLPNRDPVAGGIRVADQANRAQDTLSRTETQPMPSVGESAIASVSTPNEGVPSSSGSVGSETKGVAVSASPMPAAAARPMDQNPGQTASEPSPDISAPPSATAPSEVVTTNAGSVRDPERIGRNRPAAGTTAEFVNALNELGPKGGTVVVASDARLDLDAIDLPRGGDWTIRGEPGLARPRLTFAAKERFRGFGSQPEPLFRVAAGSTLTLFDLDIIWNAGTPVVSPSPLIAIGPGSELELTRCTITIVGARNPPSPPLRNLVAVNSEPGTSGLDATAAVRVDSSLIRAAADVIDVASGHRAEAVFTNSIVICNGALLTGHGRARGLSPDPLKLALRHSTLRVAAGLVHLRSKTTEPELPMTEVIARESILSTGSSDVPLLRVDGQHLLEELRDRVTWEGHGVVYHDIATYRRDSTALAGTSPVGFPRLSWQVAVGPHEQAPFHGDAGFQRPWPADRATWTATPEDFRLDATSMAAGAGAVIDQLPQPPRLDD